DEAAAAMIDTKSTEPNERLETPKQLAARVGISERQVRHLVQTRQLEHVIIGHRVHIPVGAFTRFLNATRVTTCHDETKGRGSAGSPSAIVSTSPGLNTAAVASARLARQTANELKKSSQNGSSSEAAAPAPVIPLRPS